MTIGLIAGGPGEEAAIRTLARKVMEKRGTREGVVSAKTRGEGDLFIARKVDVIIRALRNAHRVRKVVVCVDSHSDDQGTYRRAQETRRDLAKLWGVRLKDLPVDYVVIVHELEGWLLASEEALKAVLGKNVELNLPSDLEAHCRQADLLKELFRKNGKPDFEKFTHNRLIADKADPAQIAKRMPSFRRFVSVLRSPS